MMERRTDKNKSLAKRLEDMRYCRSLKEFLSTFKTTPCPIEGEHRIDICPHYHSPNDKRRNPYFESGLLYFLEQQCYCDYQNCTSYHSHYEYSYHPLVFKTLNCSQSCEMPGNMCYMLHKGESNIFFQQGEFFRFDINTFKTVPCNRPQTHERKVCLYFHNEKDRRRSNFSDYTHILCTRNDCNMGCGQAHNKIEQLYHPTRYKTKFCQFYNKDPNMCDYRDFCSFAHNKQEILINLIDSDNKDTNYVINNIKTVWCPYTQDHDRGDCVYAHNIQDYRRKPALYNYKPQKCPNWDFQNKIESIEASDCPAGMSCNKCHGWMEHRYHPLIFKAKKERPIKKEQLLEKKLNNPKKDKESNIQSYISKEVETSKAMYSVGAPFFKREREKEIQRDFSKGSKVTKPKTGNRDSEQSVNSSKQKKSRRALVGSSSKKISSMYFESEQHELWQCESVPKSGHNSGRSKSQGGNSTEQQGSYTRSIKDFVNDDGILNKLSKEKVNQLVLINMNERKVNCMTFLSPQEQETLKRRLQEYHMKTRKVQYSKKLTNFFKANEAEGLLLKLQHKKAKEEMISKLSKQKIKDLSFLSEEEKELLPKLLRKYGEEKEFENLMTEVREYVTKPNAEVGDV